MKEKLKIPNYDREVKEFINKNVLAPQWPFRLLIVGPSGCGKTNLLLFLIKELLHYSRIFIYAKDLTEDKYVQLEEMFDKIQKVLLKKYKISEQISTFSSSKEDIIDVDDLDSDEQNLIIFDDFLTEKDQSLIEDLFIRGRKKNCSIIYLTQSYFTTPKDIRLQCNYFIIYQIRDKREVNDILSNICIDLEKDKFIKYYNEATKKEYNFLMIDTKNKDKRYRTNFDKIFND